MARSRSHLRNAPIVEAIFDFRVLRRENVTPDTFADLGAAVGQRYDQRSPLHSIEARFGFDNGRIVDPAPVQERLGWVYRTQDEIAQFRVNGFTFSKIEPYATWELAFGEAIRLWELYRVTAMPRQVSRVAVRYINRMRLPSPMGLEYYLEAPPVVPAPIPSTIREFLSRVYVDDAARSASAVIIQALEPRVDPATISLLLDIDAFREMSAEPDDPSLPAVFEQLRQLKNDIFFASVTENTVGIYE
jgi:uncharacterized protein (TIGR04255 family)